MTKTMARIIIIIVLINLFYVTSIKVKGETRIIKNVDYAPTKPSIEDNITFYVDLNEYNYSYVVFLNLKTNNDSWIKYEMKQDYYTHYYLTLSQFTSEVTLYFFISIIDAISNNTIEIDDNNGSFFKIEIKSHFDSIGPCISQVMHRIKYDSTITSLEISARVEDKNDVKQVTVVYRLNYSNWKEKEMILKEQNIYVVSFSNLIIYENILFHYYIKAIDNSLEHNEAIANNGSYFSLLINFPPELNGPKITNVKHDPFVVTPDTKITISAEINDETGITLVKLYFFYNLNWWQLDMKKGELNRYFATIGPFEYGDVIVYKIIAIDNSSHFNIGVADNEGKYYRIKVELDTTKQANFTLIQPIFVIFIIFLVKSKIIRKSFKS